ncbi:MAG: hypothetical protein AB7L65_04725 [Hyphomonadaceae bacterium]
MGSIALIGLRIVCAWDALEVARAIARPLGAEGYLVSIATGRTGLDDLADPDRAPERLLFVWSLDGASSPYVLRWLKAAGAHPPIEIEIAKNVAPDLEGRKEAPLDFSQWRAADRGDERWKALKERVHVAVHGAPPPPSLRRVAAVMLGACAVGAVGAAAAMRAVGADAHVAVSTDVSAAAPHVEPSAPAEAMGGPLLAPESLDEEPPFVAARAFRARPLPDAADVARPLAAPSLAAPQTFQTSLMEEWFDARSGER